MVRALGGPWTLDEAPAPLPPRVRKDAAAWFKHGARELQRRLELRRPLTVGVFADQPMDEVKQTAKQAGVDLVQLSGDEPWDDCLLVPQPVIQVVHVSPLDSPSDPMEFVEPGFALVLMLDAAHGPYRGGTGRTFDWEVARAVARRMPVMLAGGLTADNVGDAIARVRPWAVDVSSGTERDGAKDHELVRAFVDAARAADRAPSTPGGAR